MYSCSETQWDRDSQPSSSGEYMAFIQWRLKEEKRGVWFFFFIPHSQQTGSESEGGAAFISTMILCCDVEVDMKQHLSKKMSFYNNQQIICV